MSRDYARKNPKGKAAATPHKATRSQRSSKPARPERRTPARAQQGGLSLKWILSLAAVGGFIGFIVYLNSLPAPEPTRQTSEPVPVTPPTKEQETATGEEKKQRYRFYEMLPESEVVPPKVEEYTPGPAQRDFTYLVQSGSFRSQKDAERQRAQIAFQGLRANVQRIDLDNGSTWYRVNVGPFNSRSQMNSAIDKLVSINIEPLVRKIPKEG
ncbi:sporulation protein [Marinobacter sp. NP-4(2019)]|uniref:SPOR domain-containing protein n=1 Tax=Marinobacter sp. NP-4(2019) TaxID=2488665 RepID=UPI000FC3CC7B|nr:SPOR domain-containing protein [Marinobacter sp. NP-4(2019)]AZT82837.1 sporulation protein [Marinobacter sp. NP-4(2019)]